MCVMDEPMNEGTVLEFRDGRNGGGRTQDEAPGFSQVSALLENHDVAAVDFNGCEWVFVEYADGRRVRLPPITASNAELEQLARSLYAHTERIMDGPDRDRPAFGGLLPNGSRLFAVSPLTPGGQSFVSIRRQAHRIVDLPQLRRLGMLDARVCDFLRALVRARKNVLITGAARIGKTTLLRGLTSIIDPSERLVTVEDVRELGLDLEPALHPDVVALHTRDATTSEGSGAVTQSDLIKWAEHLSPDRLIIGDIRGSDAMAACNALAEGHDGAMATMPASSSRTVFTRLSAYAAQAPEPLPLGAVNLLVASAVDFVIHVGRAADGRGVVSSIREVTGADHRQVHSTEVFRPGPDHRATSAARLSEHSRADFAAVGYDEVAALPDETGGEV